MGEKCFTYIPLYLRRRQHWHKKLNKAGGGGGGVKKTLSSSDSRRKIVLTRPPLTCRSTGLSVTEVNQQGGTKVHLMVFLMGTGLLD